MKYIKTFENNKPTKQLIIDQLNSIVDDAFATIEDDGFEMEQGHKGTRNWDIVRVYTRLNIKGINRLHFVGEVTGEHWKMATFIPCKIKYETCFNLNPEMYDDIIKDVENAMIMISGLSGLSFSFSFTNFYGQDKIIFQLRV